MLRRICLLLILVVAGVTLGQDEDGDEGLLESSYFYTYHGAGGNRFLAGAGNFPDVQSFDLELSALPSWLVGAALPAEPPIPTWVVALEDGSLQGSFIDADGTPTISPTLPDPLPPGMPPLFVINEIGAFPQQEFPADISPLSHPIYTPERGLYIATDGAVVLVDDEGDEIARLPLGALPDGRIALSADNTRAALYVGATDERYVHDVLGDPIEGAAMMVIDLEDGSVPGIVDLTADEIFEGLGPMWADVDGDGTQDLITTVSSGIGGAQIRVYRATDGNLLASGPTIGQAFRWRHQLAWGPFGPVDDAGEPQNRLVEVLTPHIGGVVGFYRYDGENALEIVATQGGYTSHVINSRNLDMAVGGDFNGDGQAEIVLPNQERTQIAGLQQNADGTVSEVWTLPLDGRLVTNLAAVALPDGNLVLAAGIAGEAGPRLRVWL